MNRALSLLAALLLSAPGLAAAQAAGPTVTPYGYVVANAYWNSGTFNAKDNPNIVALAPDGGAFLMSSRQSRFGFRIGYDEANWTGAKLAGVVEVDFAGGHFATNSTGWYNAIMRIRLAYGTATWKTGYGSWTVLAGQEYGLVNSLNATSIAWTANPLFWQSGNLHRRSPMMQLKYGGTFGDFSAGAQAAITTPADATGAVDYGAGNRGRQPAFEGRASVGGKFGPDISATVGASYHTANRRYVISAALPVKDLRSSLFGVDVQASLTQYFEVKGEFYAGKGGDDTYLGILSPSVINTAAASASAIALTRGNGYWAQGIVKPIPELWVYGGYGFATSDKAQALALGATTRYEDNQVAAGVIVNAGKYWRFGVEGVETSSKYLPTSRAARKSDQIALSSMLSF